jgi:hypothetical protein
LEERRVLNADAALVQHLVLDAGSAADDGQADTFHLEQDGSDVRISINGSEVARTSANQRTEISLRGSLDDDVFIADLKSGDAWANIDLHFDGGDGGQDVLRLIHSATVDQVTHELNPAGDGRVTISSAAGSTSATYQGVESVDDRLVAETRVFRTAAGEQSIAVDDAEADADGRSQISVRAESVGNLPKTTTVVFLDPTHALEIDTRAAGESQPDHVELHRFDSAFNADVIVWGGDHDRLTVAGDVDLGHGDLTALTGTIYVGGSVSSQNATISLEAAHEIVVGDAGAIRAGSGVVELASASIEHSGRVDASGGRVTLDSGDDGVTIVRGVVDVAQHNAGRIGGSVQILGARVALLDGARIDASGDGGGGTVLVGGDYQGRNLSVRNARQTFIGSGSIIRADAETDGDGGTIVVWADQITRFYGDVTARGGSSGGDGGFVEVSGKHGLSFNGNVDTTAAHGRTGVLLLDPDFIRVIDGAATTGDQDANLSADDTIAFVDANSPINTLSVGQINATGVANSLTINAGQIDFDNSTNIVMGAGMSISFAADNSAAVNSAGGDNTIQNTGGNTFSITTSGAGTITFTAGGLVDLSNVMLNSASTITVDAGGDVTLEDLSTTGAIDVTTSAGSILAASAGSLLSAATVTLSASSSVGQIGVQAINTSADNLDLTATAGDIFIDESDGVTVDAATAGGEIFLVQGSGTLTIAGAVSAGAGGITIDPPTDVDINATIDGGGGPVVIEADNNITFNNGGSITNASTVTLTADADANGAGAIVDAQAADITDITSTGLATLSAATGIGSAANALETSVDSLNVTTAGAAAEIQIVEASGLTTLTVSTNDGDVDITFNAAADSLTFTAATDALNFEASATVVDFTNSEAIVITGTSSAASLTLTATAGTITDDGTADVTVTNNASFTANGAGGAITLDDTYDFGTLTFNSVGPVDVTEATGVVLSGMSTAASLMLTATAGTITDDNSADVTVTNNASFTANGAGGAITLDDTYDFGTLTFNSAGAVAITETMGVVLSDTSTAASLTLTATAGTITDDGTADVTVTNNASFTANGAGGAITLDDTYDFGTLTFNSAGAVAITETMGVVLSDTSTAASLTLTATAGTITDDGTADVTVTNNASFTANGAGGAITLDDTYDFGTLTFNSAGAVAITETGAIDLSGASASGSTVMLVAGTSISDTAGGVVTAVLLDTTSANGTTLNTQTHVVEAFRATNTMSGDILLMNAAAGGTLDLQGVNQAGGGAVAISEANTIDLSGDILADGSMVTLTALELDMGNRTVDTNNGSDGDVTFVTDLLESPGTVDAGMAMFQIRPLDDGHVIEFAFDDSPTIVHNAFYDLEFMNITAGSFIVGGNSQEGDIHVGNDLAALIFNPSVTFRNSGTGIIFLESDYDSSVGDGSLTLDSGAGVTLRDLAANTSINVNLDAGALSVVGDATVGDDADIIARGGISFADRVDSQAGETNPLTLTASMGDIMFGGAVGNGMNQELGAMLIVDANNVTATSTIEAASLVQTAGTGTTTLSDDVTTTAAAGVDLTTAAILLDGLNIATGGGVVEMNAPTTLGGGTAVTSAGGTVAFTDMLDSAAGETNTLDLMAGSGDILFMGAVGSGANQELGAMTIMDAMNVTAMSTIEAASLVQTAGTGTTTLTNDVTTTAAAGVDLSTGGMVVLDGLNIATGVGLVRMNALTLLEGNTGVTTTGGPITFTSALASQDGEANPIQLAAAAGNIMFLGAVGSGLPMIMNQQLGAVSITSANDVMAMSTIEAASLVQMAGTGTTTIHDNVMTTAAQGVNLTTTGIVLDGLDIVAGGVGIARFGAPTQLTTAAVDVDAGGTITFESTLSSPTSEDLTVESDANINFNMAVGAGAPLGALRIDTAVDVEADSTIEAASLVQTAGTGTTTLSDDVTTTAAAGIDLTTAAILLDGLNIATGGGVVEMNAPTTLGGGTTITSAGGTVTFTGMLDSAAGETNTLDLMAGSGDILFMGAVGSGANQELGTMTIMDAMNVTAMSTIEAASLVQTAGTGTTTLMDDVTTVDQVNLVTNSIVLHGTPADELQIMATGAAAAGQVKVNLDAKSMPSLQDVVITTADGGVTSGGSISDEVLVLNPDGSFSALDNSQNVGPPIQGNQGTGTIEVTVVDSNGASFVITIDWREGRPPGSVGAVVDLASQIVTDFIDGTPPPNAETYQHLYLSAPDSDVTGIPPGSAIPVYVSITSFAQGSIVLSINGQNILVEPDGSRLNPDGTPNGIQTTITVPVIVQTLVAGSLPQSTLLPAPFSPPVVMQTAFEFPSQQVVESAPVEAQSSQGAATDVETRYYELRVVTFKVDGSLDERVEDTINLSEPSSDDTADEETSAIFPFNPGKLRELFRRLPDDHYRLYLIDEGGPRMILDFTIQQGRPVEVSDEPAAEEAAANSDETSQVDRPGGSSFWADRIDANYETDRVAEPAGSWDDGEEAILGRPTDGQRESGLLSPTFAERVGRASFVSCGSALLLATTFSDGRRRRRERSADRLMAEFSSWRRRGRIAPTAAGPTPSANRADLVTS